MDNHEKQTASENTKLSLADLAQQRSKLDPLRESFIVILVYSIFGFLWITLTDWLVDTLVSDPTLNRNIQTAKGWLFVALTMLIIFFLVKNRIEQIRLYVEKIIDTTLKLDRTQTALVGQRLLTEEIISNAPVMVAIWDDKGNLISTNPHLQELLELEKGSSDVTEGNKAIKKVLSTLQRKNRILNYETEIKFAMEDPRYIMWNGGSIIHDNPATGGFIAFGVDVTDKKIAEDKLKIYAFNDNLTMIPNRVSLQQETEKLLEKNEHLALLFMDIDNFKYINDSLGHHVGDELLKFVSSTLASIVNKPNLVARLGGDEFAIVITNYKDKQQVFSLSEKIRKLIGRTWSAYNHSFFLSLSIGVAISPDDGETFADLSKNTDIAMYQAKREGKDRVVFFEDAIELQNLYRIDMAKKLQHAIDNNEFELFFQPIYRLAGQTAVGFEVLIRWKEEVRGYISPGEFIPLAEETGQIYNIEAWVVDAAIKQKMLWDASGLKDLYLSINLSSKTLLSDANFQRIITILEAYKENIQNIVFEITETAVIDNIEKVFAQTKVLKKLGVKIALDDFGTGYSSLTHLKNLPIDIVKLDRSFISQIDKKGKDEVIVHSVISLVQRLGHELVAEGIENSEQYDYCLEHDCDFGQGYFMNKPMPAKSIEALFITDAKPDYQKL